MDSWLNVAGQAGAIECRCVNVSSARLSADWLVSRARDKALLCLGQGGQRLGDGCDVLGCLTASRPRLRSRLPPDVCPVARVVAFTSMQDAICSSAMQPCGKVPWTSQPVVRTTSVRSEIQIQAYPERESVRAGSSPSRTSRTLGEHGPAVCICQLLHPAAPLTIDMQTLICSRVRGSRRHRSTRRHDNHQQISRLSLSGRITY